MPSRKTDLSTDLLATTRHLSILLPTLAVKQSHEVRSENQKESSKECSRCINTESSQNSDLSSGNTDKSEPSSNSESLTSVFIVTEVYVPATSVTKRNGAGVWVLTPFSSVEEANAYAGGHVRQLQHLTRLRKIDQVAMTSSGNPTRVLRLPT